MGNKQNFVNDKNFLKMHLQIFEFTSGYSKLLISPTLQMEMKDSVFK